MKKISICLLSCLCFLFSSCTFYQNKLCFFVFPLDSDGKMIDNLEVEFYKIDDVSDFNKNVIVDLGFIYGLNPRREYNYESAYRSEFLYYNRFKSYDDNIKYLDWDVIQPLLDGYKIKITDPNGVYEDYYTSTIRELIEGNKKYSQYTLGGDYNVCFEFILQKKQ